MSQDSISRRDALRRAALFGAVAVTPSLLSLGCGKKELACTDTAGLDPADLALRNQLGYVDHSTEAGKNCSGCILYKPAGEGQCGGCTAVKGPINPQGYCKSWAQKPA